MLDAPLEIWGIYARLLGLTYLIAFCSLGREVIWCSGRRGITPVGEALARIARDMPGIRRFFYFPTLLWISSTDAAIHMVWATGALGAIAVIWGGSWSPLAFFVCWICYLSFDITADHVYPWEHALCECGLLALFLAPLHTLPDVSVTLAPLPWIGFLHRLLLFRVIFGFGKFKFLDKNGFDFDYLRRYLVSQPIPSRAGWYAHYLPRVFFSAGLIGMFLVEIPLPFAVFFTGMPRLVAFAGICGLMFGIQLLGNYGFFNMLIATLCVTLLDTQASVLDPIPEGYSSAAIVVSAVIAGVLLVGALLTLPFNTWVSRGWLFWPSLEVRTPAVLRALLGFYRILSQFRVVLPYGVFPPKIGPAVKVIPVFEGSDDGETWKTYRYRYMVSEEDSVPPFVAPFAPRLDHFSLYEGLGVGSSNFHGSTFSIANPYRFSRISMWHRVVRRLLEGGDFAARAFAGDPFAGRSPKYVRVSTYVFTPRSLAEHRATGLWWKKVYAGEHLPRLSMDSLPWEHWPPEPELFHPDERVWVKRMPQTRRPELFAAADRAEFWSEFIPAASAPASWEQLPSLAQDLETRFGRERFRQADCLFARHTLALVARLEPHFLGGAEPRLPVESYFHLYLVAQQIVGRGETAWRAAMDQPAVTAAMPFDMEAEIMLRWLAIFRGEALSFHARKLRLVDAVFDERPEAPPKILSGFYQFAPFLHKRFSDPE